MDDVDGEWQVKLGRRRRRLYERMSREHHEPEVEVEADKASVDRHGNVVAPPAEAVRRVATAKEMRRIKKKGGFVSPPEEEWGGPARVWLDANMTLPGLAMARSTSATTSSRKSVRCPRLAPDRAAHATR